MTHINEIGGLAAAGKGFLEPTIKHSPLDNNNIQLLLEDIKATIIDALDELDYTTEIENNNFNRMCLADDVNQVMQTLEDKDIVSDFNVICDETNNTARVINNGHLNVDIMIKPVNSCEFVSLYMTLVQDATHSDALEEEILAALSEEVIMEREAEEGKAKYNADMDVAAKSMALEIRNEIDAEIIGELIRLNDEIDDANFDRAMKGI